MQGILYLEDGTIYAGKGFGKTGTSVGELVFNTSMTGYEQILTDPSYACQVITMTYPLIGNYGINKLEQESNRVHAKGFVVKSISQHPSNYMKEETLDEFLKRMNVVGVYDVDTRSITKKIRKEGTVKCVISNENLSIAQLETYIKTVPLKEDLIQDVSTVKIIHIPGTGPKVAVIDFGSKANIIRNLKEFDCDITIFPYNSTYDEIMAVHPDGVLLSNGPGDPKSMSPYLPHIRKIIKKLPTFGICLGHQVLALALGGDTYKMKYGHRGGNHGVYDMEREKAYITSQNHGYSVNPESIKDKGMIVTHVNLNDGTVEGMRHRELPVFSVQFHPEGAPGPEDTAYLFEKFLSSMN
ncbi:glutamine-hydrolyzing carbamoyl-phosphate synthase small subunit [Fonticella tunisiensis]|uniref:Carbamoyl phosphate synthase small chain n=1 Tax=Fonticella tunisiensis TaxID=1096341 RepID=A0A4R7KSZ3_9CLOT|nr:glutamine-hydrolyzing carbamoyl-phosphate synthase small subunit [Fonticella tunisiensis]TDT62832.1 carbamoyl-phosphate synthase small subunit [Fonticella tunisiensis]